MKNLMVSLVMVLGLNIGVLANENEKLNTTNEIHNSVSLKDETIKTNELNKQNVNENKNEGEVKVDDQKEINKKIIYLFYFICLFTGGGIILF